MMIHPRFEIDRWQVQFAFGYVVEESKRHAGKYPIIHFDGGPLDGTEFVTRDDHNYFTFLVCEDPPGVEYERPNHPRSIFPPGLFAVYARAYPRDERPHIGRVPMWFQGLFHSTNPMIFQDVRSPYAMNPEKYFQ